MILNYMKIINERFIWTQVEVVGGRTFMRRKILGKTK